MLTKTAEGFFGGRKGIAKALSTRTAAAVYLWDDVVPLMAAKELSELSGGKLNVEESLYDRYGRIIRKTKKRA